MKQTPYYLITLLWALLVFSPVFGQSSYLSVDFEWKEQITMLPDSNQILVPYSEKSVSPHSNKGPIYSEQIALEEDEEVEVEANGFYLFKDLDGARYSDYLSLIAENSDPIKPGVAYHTVRKRKFATISIPLIEMEAEGKARVVTHITIKWKKTTKQQNARLSKKGVNWRTESVLKEGSWIKLNIIESGMYRIGVSQIQGYGINVLGQEVGKLRMYGYNMGMLPEDNSQTKYDDLEEMAIEVRDKNGNGLLDNDDDIIFFAHGPHELIHTNSEGYFRKIHLYSDLSSVFLTLGNAGGKRIQSVNSNANSPNYTTNSFDEIIHQEEERFNLIKSGKDWFGREFGRIGSEHVLKFDLPGQIIGDTLVFQTRATARSEFTSSLIARVNGKIIQQHTMPSVNIFNYAAQFASTPSLRSSSFIAAGPLDITLTYSKPNDAARAWLDFAEIIYRRRLSDNGQLLFRDRKSINTGFTRYNFDGLGYSVWDLSDPLNIKRINLLSDGGNQYFVAQSNDLIEYASLRNEAYKSIHSWEGVANQNIHGERNIDYLIVAHPNFISEAKRLAEFHETESGLKTLVVEPKMVYNEFSSGVPDISAIRNMMRYFYENATPGNEPKYLLLFGDASFDYKNNLKGNNTNFVPTYESENSVAPVGSYCTDDYFGLLDEDEGINLSNSGYLDIGIGRLPVQNAAEAKNMVDKIIRYHQPEGLGDWRNNVVMLTDDEDNNVHMHDGILFSNIMENNHKDFNVRKIFADAYKQTTVGNGQRYPDVVKEVDRAFNEGALIVNYSGHGGEIQLGAEKFVDIPQINSWKGGAKLPLFITATCEFTRFDDPARQSAGELVMLNPNGGGIGLLTTVRLVYQWPNRQLNRAFYENNAFSYNPNSVPSIGDVLLQTKNAQAPTVNGRSFVYIGDPAIKLAYPKYAVSTTHVNTIPIDQFSDTLKALSTVVLEGEVRDHQNQVMSNFNGILYTTVFSSKQTITTLANDPGSKVESFKAFNSIAYKGKASVRNGLFRVEFILPRDLPFQIGEAKISYYVENGTDDGNGHTFFVMSPEIDPNAVPDFKGPAVRLFMNDSNFIRGGITDENPYIYALVYDESGINTTGIGIGRAITAILDENSQNAIILNEYYDASIDDFRRGTVRYPLSGLREGPHRLRIKVWDVHNNSSEATTEFLVAPSVKIAISNLIAYPNPFSNSTTVSFEHNQTGKELIMEVRIYDLKGSLVKSINATELNAGSRVDNFEWDPYRDGANEVLPGMYLFKLIVKDKFGNAAEGSSRIVYLPNP